MTCRNHTWSLDGAGVSEAELSVKRFVSVWHQPLNVSDYLYIDADSGRQRKLQRAAELVADASASAANLALVIHLQCRSYQFSCCDSSQLDAD